MFYSCRGLGFSSQHPSSVAQTMYIQLRESQYFWLLWSLVLGCIPTQRHTEMHIIKNKSFFKRTCCCLAFRRPWVWSLANPSWKEGNIYLDMKTALWLHLYKAFVSWQLGSIHWNTDDGALECLEFVSGGRARGKWNLPVYELVTAIAMAIAQNFIRLFPPLLYAWNFPQ